MFTLGMSTVIDSLVLLFFLVSSLAIAVTLSPPSALTLAPQVSASIEMTQLQHQQQQQRALPRQTVWGSVATSSRKGLPMGLLSANAPDLTFPIATIQ